MTNIKVMKLGTSISTILMALSAISYGQAVPTAVSPTTPASSAGTDTVFSLPSADGTVHYALSASEILRYGYDGAGKVTPTGALSGDVSYSSPSLNLPFSLLFAGGVLFPETSSVNTTSYVDVAVSQSLIARKWVLGISDSFSYLPQSRTVGLSGIPGVGDIGTIVPPGVDTGGILTGSGSRISNGVNGTVERLFTGRTSASGSGFLTVLHFLGNSQGFDSRQYGGQVSLNHRIDARDTVSADGVYSVYTYGSGQNGISFISKGINGVYSRVISRTISAHVSAGPQWISSNDSALIPNRLSVAVSAGLTYVHKLTTVNLDYIRGVNSGSGVQLGGLRDSVSLSLDHSISPDWLVTSNVDYARTTSLATHTSGQPVLIPGFTIPLGGNFTTIYGGAQLTRRFSRTLSAYASYIAQHQTFDANYTGTAAFNGTSQTFGVGVSFTPRSTRLGQF